MFLYLLEEQQKLPFLELAQLVIKADNVIAKEEMAMLSLMERELSAKPPSKESGKTLAELAAFFHSEKAKTAVALELLGIAYADNKFVESERDLLNKLFNIFGFGKSKIDALKAWVVKQLSLIKEAENFWKESD